MQGGNQGTHVGARKRVRMWVLEGIVCMWVVEGGVCMWALEGIVCMWVPRGAAQV